MNISLRQLEIFLAISESLNYSRASEQIHITQSGITRQMQALEKELGEPLIKRVNQQFELTSAGKKLKVYARNIANDLETLKYNALKIKDEMVGTAYISIIPTISSAFFYYLNQFAAQYPKVTYHISSNSNINQQHALRENKHDFYIMSKPPADIPAETYKLVDSKVIVAMSVNNPLAKRKTLSLKSLKKERFIIAENTTVNYPVSMDIFNELNCLGHQRLMLSEPAAIRHAVAANIGIAIVVDQMFNDMHQHQHIVMKPLSDVHKQYGIYLAHRKNKSFTPAVETLKQYILKHMTT